MEKIATTVCKLSHKQFRAILKKFRRKRIRQKLAKEREKLELLEQQKRENSPNYKEREEEIRRNSELYDQFEEKERIRKHKLWLYREECAQKEFREKQQRLESERIKREAERKRILEEFEKQEYVEKQAENEIKKRKSQKEEALQEALSNLSEADGPWHNPIAPMNYIVGQEREQCKFFFKTGCCKFGERCKRSHIHPATSTTILIRGMYSHFSIDQTARDDYDTDIALEYEDKECYQDFKNFYYDVLPEFKKFGKVIQFKVCNNFEPHLRGNVYVQYTREEDAIEAYKNFNGRYYAGRQITCDFTHVICWRSAICGLYARNDCPKGINCNFLHVFKNPKNEFWEASRDFIDNYRDDISSRKRDYSKEDRFHSSSEHRHRSSKHESRSDRYETRNDRHESSSDRYESRSDRHVSRSDRHELRSDRHEPRSDRYESRSDRYESRSDRYESRSDRYESRSDRHESRSDRHESGSDRYESKDNKYGSRNNRYESRFDARNHSEVDTSESSSDSYEENNHFSKYINAKHQTSHNSKHRKRSRNLSSSPRSDSSSEDSYPKKSSHKKKKHKKKCSKINKKKEYNGNSTE